jgi:hypothetical protein
MPIAMAALAVWFPLQGHGMHSREVFAVCTASPRHIPTFEQGQKYEGAITCNHYRMFHTRFHFLAQAHRCAD